MRNAFKVNSRELPIRDLNQDSENKSVYYSFTRHRFDWIKSDFGVSSDACFEWMRS